MPGRGSSNTSSTTSTSSCTSSPLDGLGPPSARGAPIRDRILGLIRLGHPFPSALNGLATAALALLAGGTWASATRLGFAMLTIQVSIGALNDLRDAPADAIAKPAKPIPAGVASPLEAGTLWAVGLVTGVILSLPSGPIVVLIASVGAASGYAYDLWLKRTPLSWLPLSAALPLLPAYAWLGVGTELPAAFVALVPLAVLAGAALALSNALVDVEGDRAAGLATLVARLGRQTSWRLHVLLVALVAGGALALLPIVDGRGPGVIVAVGGASVLVVGALLERGEGVARRERAWELEAVGVAALGIGWLAAIVPAG